ncbi:putative ABC polysaccharide/polyol phosphate export pump, inner membrane subunit [Candidatus Competibacter denitrificans Run_A_D11]|uniref:Transport permease protein n=2 Tax=Candidatus Competibacter TaxID=221279 RepID=W6MA21_9GAMM|nr:putative ABC polysaccharide/polyol phosphate export pump, inner membrane subunit [Candidatus Competibacter denitrificans Run_A_D11]HAS86253.1 ABC transporter permease [Candidatus Competibacteraceae bacterium]HRC69602.1 ABC transporter permease [Candidatus Competibacter denitrificans]
MREACRRRCYGLPPYPPTPEPMRVTDLSEVPGTTWTLCQVLRQSWLQRQLFLKLLRRDFAERYRGSYLGAVWAVLLPLLSLTVFTFFFGVIFKIRWPAAPSGDSLHNLALILFIGMALYNFLAECLCRAPGLILAHQSYVKNVVFPLDMLPAVMVTSALLMLGVTLAVILLLQALVGELTTTVLLLPVIVLPLVLSALGLSWFLSALGVFIRDTQQLVVPLVQLLMFLSPVFYPASALPSEVRPWLEYNPLALVIEQARGIILFAQPPAWIPYLFALAASLLLALLGAYWFARTRKGFADVL